MTDIIASVSGIRGIYGDSLTPQNLIKFSSAFAAYLKIISRKKRIKIALGRDGRMHGDIISDIVINNLLMSGVDVIYLGAVPTPTVQTATEDMKCTGGISVTASHNPQEWNGLKFLNADGTFLDESQVKKFLRIAENGNFQYAGESRFGSLRYDFTWIDRHIEKVLRLKILNIAKIRKRKFKAVVDAVNSSGSVIVPLLLKKLGCKVIELHCNGSGIFPHLPEPVPENLKSLSDAVKENKADFGISVDPDADRLVLITDTGEPFGEENTITAVSNFVLKNYHRKKNKSVTVNLSTTRSVDDIAKKNKAEVYRSPVGEINVVKEMQKRKSVIGGEGSGGVIYPELHYGRDSAIGIALMLNELSDFNGKLSDYKKTLPEYYILKSKIVLKETPDSVLNEVKKQISKDKSLIKIRTDDGLKADFKNYWIHLRKSNTEPIIRIIVEAKSNRDSVDKLRAIEKIIADYNKK